MLKTNDACVMAVLYFMAVNKYDCNMIFVQEIFFHMFYFSVAFLILTLSPIYIIYIISLLPLVSYYIISLHPLFHRIRFSNFRERLETLDDVSLVGRIKGDSSPPSSLSPSPWRDTSALFPTAWPPPAIIGRWCLPQRRFAPPSIHLM